MRRRVELICMLLSLALVCGCAAGELPQDQRGTDAGGGRDAGVGDSGDGGSDAPSYDPPELYHTTSGGDLSTSEQHRMQLDFGAPIPRGTATGDDYRIRFGPVSP